MDEDPAGRRTRRELIAGALAAGSAGALGFAAPALGAQTPVDDHSLLNSALQYEQLALLAMRHVLTLPSMAGPGHRLVRHLIGHERAHAHVLAEQLVGLGYAPPSPPTSLQAVDQALSAHNMSGHLATVSTLKDAVQILLDVEALCEGAYYTAVGKLSDPGAMVLAAQALGCEAQHATLLSALLPKADIKQTVPYWYVSGVT